MSRLSLALLGPFQAHLGTRPLKHFRTSKVQALLVFLVAEPDPHGRESLMELFWPGMPEHSARHNLRQVLYYLRGAIPTVQSSPDADGPSVPLLLSNRQTIQLNPAADVSADIHRFDALIESTQRHTHLDLVSCQTCRKELEEVVAIYTGDFLADFYLDDSVDFEDWAQVRREACRRRVLDALEILATMAIRQQDYPLARTLAERQLEIDNLREGSYRQLMQALVLSGRREEALAVYDACRRVLAEELAMEPARRTTEIYDQILAGDIRFEGPQSYGIRGYEIKEEIGAGAYGTIHRAIQPIIGREVAVKVIRRRYANNPEFIRRFEDEAQTIARLEHPYVVPLYDYWRDPDGAYLVMRYMKGGSLLSTLRNGPWDLPQTVRLVEQIACALTAAHQLGVVHRDIKPANILLDGEGNAFLSDFGIAKVLNDERSLIPDGGIMGTPDYISPEQILNEKVGPESDLYSLGAVLFETLTGEKPFGHTSVANLIYKHLNEPLPFLSESRPDLPSQIDPVLQKATAKLPADRYKHALELAEAFHRAALGVEENLGLAVPVIAPMGKVDHNPYKGLRAFHESDAEDFFGRELLVDRLLTRLMPERTHSRENDSGTTARFLAVVGPSGSGKSSVVKAGLIPALRSGAIPGSEKWFIAEMVPGTHPLEELEMALWPIAVDPPPSLVEPMQRDVRGMLRTLRRILPDEPRAQLLLIIDQFEELFTRVDDEERRTFFLESLMVAISAARSPLRVVVTLRADFYDRPLQLQTLGQLLNRTTEIVLPLSAEELTWAIREPARHVGVTLEAGLAEAIVADVSDQPGALPLMQYALTELFERRQANQLTRAAYQEIGGVQGALRRRAEAIYLELDADAQMASRQIFVRLVSLGDGVADTRRRVLRSDLETMAVSQLQFAIDAFADARLLTLDRDPLTRAPTVEVAHEALLQEWERLRGWLDESRDDIRLQQQLARATTEWLRAGQDSSYLLHGARLAQFEDWARVSRLALANDESVFLAASLAARASRRTEEEARRQHELETAHKLAETESRRAQEQVAAAHRLRRRAQLLAGILALALFLAVIAVLFGRNANINANLAQSRELAAASLLSQNTDPELSLLLAMQALSTAETSDAEQALHLALLASRVRQRLVGHQAAIQRVAYSPDGQLIALAAHGENLVTLWDSASGRKLHEIPVDQCCWGLYFDDKGRRLAVADPGEGFSLAIWDTTTGEKLGSFPLPIPNSEIVFYDLSPDWMQAAFFLFDETLSVWDVQVGRRLFDLPGHKGTVEMEYSDDGRRLVTYDNPDGLVLVWNTETGELIRRLETRQYINDHAVSPNGRQVALAVDTGRTGWEVHIWGIDGPAGDTFSLPSVRLKGHPDTIRLIDFSADGQMIASASRDGTSRIWDVTTGETLYVLPHSSHVRSVAFHPDGQRLLSGDLYGVARVWDITPQGSSERIGFVASDGPSFGADLSPDGRTLATGGPGRLWDLATGTLLRDLDGHDDMIMSVAFDPDGRHVATASMDGTARIWDTTTGEELVRMEGHGEGLTAFGFPGVLSVDYHPAGDRLATAGADGTARIWDSESGQELYLLEGHTSDLSAVTFSPDGIYLATGQASGERGNVVISPTTVRIWETESGKALFSFDSRHGNRVWGLAFSPDGHYLATSGTDAAVRLWALNFDAGRAELLTTLTNHANTINAVKFSPDGRILASATPDEVRLWELSTILDGSGDSIIAELLLLPGGPSLAFSPDGTELITGGRDGLIRVYLLDPTELLAFAHTRLTRWWTDDECRLYLHADSCPPEPSE